MEFFFNSSQFVFVNVVGVRKTTRNNDDDRKDFTYSFGCLFIQFKGVSVIPCENVFIEEENIGGTRVCT